MSVDDSIERLSPAEQRLEQHLQILREAPAAPANLTGRVIRAVRWQRNVRSPLLAVAHLAEAALDAVRLLLGGRRA